MTIGSALSSGLGGVAPLAGSVDRNGAVHGCLAGHLRVAPLAGSVDRNLVVEQRGRHKVTSLPSRGAWIEIALSHKIKYGSGQVAPLAGSVDRNWAMITSRKWESSRSPRGERG